MRRFWRCFIKSATPAGSDGAGGESRRQDGGYYMRLDAAGLVTELSPALRAILPDRQHLGTALVLDLAQPLGSLQGSPAQWPQQLSLSFKGRNDEQWHFQAGLLEGDGEWALMLLDVTAHTLTLRYEERRREVMDFSVSQAISMRQAPLEDMLRLTEDWLEGLRLRFQVPWLGLFIPGLKHWQLYAASTQPGYTPLGWDDVELQEAFACSSSHIAFEWQSAATGRRAWLVPYSEHDGVRVWMIISGADMLRRVPFFNQGDWHKLLMPFAAPLSSGLRYLEVQRKLQRNAVLEALLDSGWWELNTVTRRLSMTPTLAQRLALELSADGSMSLEHGLSVFDPLDRELVVRRLEEAEQYGIAFSDTVMMRTVEGGRWFRLKGEMIRSPTPRIVGYALDISDLREQQEETTAARARLEGLLDNAPAVIFVQNYRDGCLSFEFCSASLVRLLGWTLQDLQSTPFSSFVHMEDRDFYHERTLTLLKTGYSSGRYRVRDSRGDYHWILEESKLLRDSRGLPVEVVGLMMDVTDATEAQERIRESEERYRVLVEDSPAIICRYLPDLTLTYANQMLLKSLGQPDLALHAINIAEFLSKEDQQATIQRLATLTPEDPVRTVEFSPQTSHGQRVKWLWTERGLFDSTGQLVEVQAVGRDDTALYEARDQLFQSAKMATLGEMATGMAHEINQPLTVMRMALTNIFKRLNRGELEPEYLKLKLERVENQVSRASRIVDHVRIFGRTSEVKGICFDPCESLQAAVLLVQESMDKDGVSLELNMEPVPQVVGHQDRLEQVLINLLLNGQYAAQHRSANDCSVPLVKVGCRPAENGILISVEDNGDGIEPRMLKRIFEPFVTTKPVGVGTGLGLSVSYGIINQMRGELTAENTPHGARFSIFLPACSAPDSDEDSEELNASPVA